MTDFTILIFPIRLSLHLSPSLSTLSLHPLISPLYLSSFSPSPPPLPPLPLYLPHTPSPSLPLPPLPPLPPLSPQNNSIFDLWIYIPCRYNCYTASISKWNVIEDSPISSVDTEKEFFMNRIWISYCSQHVHELKINLSSGKKRKWILTESNETYTEYSRLQINVMCHTILEENVYWVSNEHRKIRKSG